MCGSLAFVFLAIFICVCSTTGNIIIEARDTPKRSIPRVVVNENILSQLKTHKQDGNKELYNEPRFVKSFGKRTLQDNNEHLDRYLSINMRHNEDKYQGKRQLIAPGYYEAECSDKKPCKQGKYCNLLYCEDCHKNKMACSRKKQCCDGMVCTFGRCEKMAKGDPGTFCEKDSDCKSDSCCVLEPTVNTLIPICKPKLGEYHQCASILYRKIWIGEKPDCGPCKQGLECTQKGILASHQVCMKPLK